MKIGISTSTFFNTVAPENVFDILSKMNVSTAELCLNTFSDYEKPYVDSLAALRGGVSVVSVAPLSSQFEPQLFSPNMRVRADAELIFRKVCYACFAFGAKFYTFNGPINLLDVKTFDYVRLAQRFSQLQDIASMYGVTLALKNTVWSYASTPTFFEQIMSRCPRVYAALDLNHAELAGYDIRDFLDVVPQDHVALINVCDFFKGEQCLPGWGKYKFDRLFSDLERRQCTAPVLIAAPGDSYTDFVQVRDSYEYVLNEYRAVTR